MRGSMIFLRDFKKFRMLVEIMRVKMDEIGDKDNKSFNKLCEGVENLFWGKGKIYKEVKWRFLVIWFVFKKDYFGVVVGD